MQINMEFISMTSLAAKGEDEPGMMQGTADVPHQSADVHLPEAAAVCDAATALDTARDMADPQPTLVELLGSHVLLTREFLPHIGINSSGVHRGCQHRGVPLMRRESAAGPSRRTGASNAPPAPAAAVRR
jgi:hypothetical protein